MNIKSLFNISQRNLDATEAILNGNTIRSQAEKYGVTDSRIGEGFRQALWKTKQVMLIAYADDHGINSSRVTEARTNPRLKEAFINYKKLREGFQDRYSYYARAVSDPRLILDELIKK